MDTKFSLSLQQLKKDPELTEIKLECKTSQQSQQIRSKLMNQPTDHFLNLIYDRSVQFKFNPIRPAGSTQKSISVNLTKDAAINVHIVHCLSGHGELTQPKRYSSAHTQLLASLTHPRHCSLATIPIYYASASLCFLYYLYLEPSLSPRSLVPVPLKSFSLLEIHHLC